MYVFFFFLAILSVIAAGASASTVKSDIQIIIVIQFAIAALTFAGICSIIGRIDGLSRRETIMKWKRDPDAPAESARVSLSGIGYAVGGFLGTLALAGAAYAIFMR